MTQKIFCIGANRTGTTSIAELYRSEGLRIGDHIQAGLLYSDWAYGNYDSLIALCDTADVFTDFPFSLPGTFQALHGEFHDAKFVVSTRDPDQWFESVKRFLMMACQGREPTVAGLDTIPYVYPGFVLDAMSAFVGTDFRRPELFLFERLCKAAYRIHYSDIERFFKITPDKVLNVDVSEADAAKRLLEFAGLPYIGQAMPHMNASTG